MKKEVVRSVAAVTATVVAVCILWYVGNIVVASMLGGALASQLIRVFVFESKAERRENRIRFLDTKLTEVYSPIHYITMRMNQVVPLESGEGFIPVSDFGTHWNKFVSIITSHAHEIGDERFQKWMTFKLSHEHGSSGKAGFYLDRSWADWFLNLEAEYQKLKKELDDLSKK